MNFFEEKITIDKNLTIYYVNCDSVQLHFLKDIWIVSCLTFCNLIVPSFLINSFSITFICLSPWISGKHFTASRLSRTSDAVTFLTSCLSNIIFWLQELYNAFFWVFLLPIYVCWINNDFDAIVSWSVISLEICTNNSWNSVSVSSIMIDISLTSKQHFLKHCLMFSVDAVLSYQKLVCPL